MKHYFSLVGFFFLITTAGCSRGADQTNVKSQELNLGLAQKEIRKGMAQVDVVSALGSPNIVTKDADGAQAWVYDKIATEVSQSQNGGGFWLLLGGYSKESGSRISSQKTLTIIIKFNEQELVDTVSYNSSQF